jgi:geranylgeranylglycerol-phosphate geranylgeranyltransferase
MPVAGDGLYAHVQTWRPYTTAYGVLVALAGYLLAAGHHITVWRMMTLAAAVVMVWIGGHYLADYFDRELDARSKPQRPIPSGRLAERTAVRCGLAGFAGFGVIAGLLSWWSLIPAVLCVAGMVAYMGWLKSHGAWGNAARGAVTGSLMLFGASIGVVGATARLRDVLPFAIALALHDCSSNIVGSLRDIRGDGRAGCRTLAVRKGVRGATAWAAGLYSAALVLVLTTSVLRSPYDWTAMALQAAGAALGASAFSVIGRTPKPLPAGPALKAHEILVVERVVLAVGIICLAAGAMAAFLALVPAVAGTVWPQAVMRRSYELRRQPSL